MTTSSVGTDPLERVQGNAVAPSSPECVPSIIYRATQTAESNFESKAGEKRATQRALITPTRRCAGLAPSLEQPGGDLGVVQDERADAHAAPM